MVNRLNTTSWSHETFNAQAGKTSNEISQLIKKVKETWKDKGLETSLRKQTTDFHF